MREKSIDGKYIGDAIGFCHYSKHEGAINRKLAYEHRCIAKKLQIPREVQQRRMEAKAEIL